MGVMQRIQGYVNSIVGTFKVTELFIRNERRDDEAIAVLKELFSIPFIWKNILDVQFTLSSR